MEAIKKVNIFIVKDVYSFLIFFSTKSELNHKRKRVAKVERKNSRLLLDL